MNIYIDESGCLGFNFSKTGTSKYLVLTALVCKEPFAKKSINHAINRTLKNKIKHRKGSKGTKELKGHLASLEVKKYFYDQIKLTPGWELYAIIADKSKWPLNQYDKSQFYDHVLIELIKEVWLSATDANMNIVLDKSKNAALRAKLNSRLVQHFGKNRSQLIVFHEDSSLDSNLQAVDLFCTGIAKKFEQLEETWFKEFESKIRWIKLICN